MTYDPKAIANFFIEAAASEGRTLTPLQVIKLVYIAHGWHLGLVSQPLINEPPEAWQYGPVVPSLYHTLKVYGNGPVREPISQLKLGSGSKLTFTRHSIPSPQEDGIRNFLLSVWKAYGHLSGTQLSTLTHQAGTPWQRTWDEKGAKYTRGVDIPEDLIRDHYIALKTRSASDRATRN